MWTVIVEQIGRQKEEDERFAIWLFDPVGPKIRGPDGIVDHKGYFESPLRTRLSEFYKLPDSAINLVVETAKSGNKTDSSI